MPVLIRGLRHVPTSNRQAQVAQCHYKLLKQTPTPGVPLPLVAELLLRRPWFPAESDIEQLSKVSLQLLRALRCAGTVDGGDAAGAIPTFTDHTNPRASSNIVWCTNADIPGAGHANAGTVAGSSRPTQLPPICAGAAAAPEISLPSGGCRRLLSQNSSHARSPCLCASPARSATRECRMLFDVLPLRHVGEAVACALRRRHSAGDVLTRLSRSVELAGEAKWPSTWRKRECSLTEERSPMSC